MPIMSTRKLGRIAAVFGVVVITMGLSAQIVLSEQRPLLTDQDAAQLGLEIRPLPGGLAGSLTALDTDTAIQHAKASLHTTEAPVEVHHVLTRQFSDSPEVTAFIVVFAGGDPIPGGPVGSKLHPVSYRGVVIDDQTGEILRIFATGGI
jgi:hypothetical protein